ncbi:hypothetical protein [Phenylobacterium sp.]|uniref:hypothetical protein n=1 Tax=Phenylobacterium sp. TaxID=1871053 RepID=UPI0037CAAFC7
MRRLLAAALVPVLLAACTPPAGGATDAGDPYAGLDSQILVWRGALEAEHPACATKVDGKGCQDFQVMCKAAQEITPEETGRGVTAQLVAAMTFAGRNADGSTGKSGSAFAVFTKTGTTWSREGAPPVNLSTCAPL